MEAARMIEYYQIVDASGEQGWMTLRIRINTLFSSIYAALGIFSSESRLWGIDDINISLHGNHKQALSLQLRLNMSLCELLAGSTALGGIDCLTMMQPKDMPTRHIGEIITGCAIALVLSTLAESVKNSRDFLISLKLCSGLLQCDINDALFQKIAYNIGGELVSWEIPEKADVKSSAIGALTKNFLGDKKITGHFSFLMTYRNKHGITKTLNLFLKAKGDDTEVLDMMSAIAETMGGKMPVIFDSVKYFFFPKDCHTREIEMAKLALKSPEMYRLCPDYYCLCLDKMKGHYCIFMEHLGTSAFTHLNTTGGSGEWNDESISLVVAEMARFHAHHIVPIDTSDLPAYAVQSSKWLINSTCLVQEFFDHHTRVFPSDWTADRVKMVQSIINNIPEINRIINETIECVVHNDIGYRNMCIRKRPCQYKSRVCLYDWEMAGFGAPHSDIAHLLISTLPVATPPSRWQHFINLHRDTMRQWIVKRGVEKHAHKFMELDEEMNTKIFDCTLMNLLCHGLLPWYTLVMIQPGPEYELITRACVNYLSYRKDSHEFLTSYTNTT